MIRHIYTPAGWAWALACAALSPGCATPDMPVAPAAFYLSSPSLADNAALQQRHAGNFKKNPNCRGDNVSPPLQWSNVPAQSRSLVLLMDLDVQPGDMVTVHQGCAIERIPAERAQQAWALYDEMLARADARPDSGSAPMAD